MQSIKFRILILISSLLVIAAAGVFLVFRDTKDDKGDYFTDSYQSSGGVSKTPEPPSIIVPCIPTKEVGCGELSTPNIQNNSVFSVSDYSGASRTYFVISNSITSKNAKGEDGEVFKYGDKVTLNLEKEILLGDEGNMKPSGLFIKSQRGLLIDSLSPAYKKVFTVNADSYKQIPIEVKYKILEKANTPCGISGMTNVDSIATFLFGTVPNSIWSSYDKWNGLNSCSPSYALPRSPFIAENAVAYADLDDSSKTKNHVLVVLENVQHGSSNSGGCTGIPVIFSIDVDGEYYARDIGAYNVCYVKALKKGTEVDLVKIVQSGDGQQSEAKEKFVLPSDSFVLHLDNKEITYLLYDQTTSTQVKIIPSKEYVYSSNTGGYH